MKYELKLKANEKFSNLMKDIDDKTWRKIELLRLAFDIVDKSAEYSKIWENDEKLDYLEEFAEKIVVRTIK